MNLEYTIGKGDNLFFFHLESPVGSREGLDSFVVKCYRLNIRIMHSAYLLSIGFSFLFAYIVIGSSKTCALY